MSLATSTAALPASPRCYTALDPCSSVDAAAHADAVRGVVEIDLALRHAGPLRVHARYELLGSDDAPVVLVAGGISADRHVAASETFPEAGWWESQVGTGRVLDPRHRRILAIDWLGADGTLDAP